jgi:hypothetical protein
MRSGSVRTERGAACSPPYSLRSVRRLRARLLSDVLTHTGRRGSAQYTKDVDLHIRPTNVRARQRSPKPRQAPPIYKGADFHTPRRNGPDI